MQRHPPISHALSANFQVALDIVPALPNLPMLMSSLRQAELEPAKRSTQ
jgi:hypothetical protein